MNQQAKSGPSFEQRAKEQEEKTRLKRALFDKAIHNAEQIGQIKTMPFNMREVERCRALYKEIDKLYEEYNAILL